MLFMMCTVYEEDEKIFEARQQANGYILRKRHRESSSNPYASNQKAERP